MYAHYLNVDDLHSDKERDDSLPYGEYDNPSLEVILSAIQNLDGNHRSLVTIGNKRLLGEVGERYMGIGGGPKGYVCLVSDEGDDIALIAPEGSDEDVEIMFGQPTPFSANRIVPLEHVLLAGKVFAESGKLPEELTWENY